MSEQKSALATLAETKLAATNKTLDEMSQFASFNWKELPPNVMAKVLMKKPYRGKANEPDYYLSPEQALVFAMRCFELGLSPLSSEVWFDRDRWSVNVTLEGKLRLARERGNVGPPMFQEKFREWKKGATPLAGFQQEPGINCTITVGPENKPCSYMCWMSEWYVASSPVWKAKPMHMLQIRAYDKALAFAAGVGVSDMPSEREIQAEDVPELPTPTITAKRVEFSSGFQRDAGEDLEPILQASLDAAKK